MRANYYVFFNILSPLASVQTKGIVVCYYDLSKLGAPTPMPPLSRVRKFMAFMKTIPIRRTGMHFCLKTTHSSLLSNNFLLENVFRGLQKSTRVRARVHYGSDMELQYKIRGHGLPAQNLPVDSSGNIRNDILNFWLHRYLAGEWNQRVASASSDSGMENVVRSFGSSIHRDDDLATTAAANSIENSSRFNVSKLVVEPTPRDVLLGRGRGNQLHPGNIRFRAFLNEFQEEYENTPKYTRIDTPTEITRRLLADGVRFLRKEDNGGGWVEISFGEVERKVKQLFRTRKKMKKATS